MKFVRALKLKGEFSIRKFLSTSIVAISVFVLLSRAASEFGNYNFQALLLRVEAKCPGLPFGGYSSGPDYIDLAIDGSLAVVAAVFIALTIRDLRRRRRLDSSQDNPSQPGESDDL
ncbi:MAG: hypothetical protein OK439_04100 [Thaumarchaeota archaeon]|nr:hypothetical protein [Nitrososphaerota archaeon]